MADVREVWASFGELSAIIGMMDAVFRASPTQYRPLTDGWLERLDELVQFTDRQIHEITDFGEAYDSEPR